MRKIRACRVNGPTPGLRRSLHMRFALRWSGKSARPTSQQTAPNPCCQISFAKVVPIVGAPIGGAFDYFGTLAVGRTARAPHCRRCFLSHIDITSPWLAGGVPRKQDLPQSIVTP